MVDAKKIVRLYRVGHSMGSIAKKLDCDKATVRYHLKKMNVEIRPSSQFHEAKRTLPTEKIIHLYVSGKSLRQIAKLANVSYNCIWHILKTHNITRRPFGKMSEKSLQDNLTP